MTLVLRPHEARAHAGGVGRPALGVQVRLGEQGDATEGEVQVRAPNLARGYHGLPDDPSFAGGWFRTGDLARIDAQGWYTIVGRSKELIISGGENIHPAEIEQLALADASVADAAAVGLPDPRWGEVPVLAVVARPGARIDVEAMRDRFDGALARFKHPRRIVVLDALPRTALGKVQRPVLARLLAQDTA